MGFIVTLLLYIAGEPYQYVGGTANTVTWDQAPRAVISARELILQRMKQALGIDGGFNEVLSAAYMEKQKMAVSDIVLFRHAVYSYRYTLFLLVP